MTYNRLGVFGGFVVEEAVHNLAGRRIYNLENYDDFDPGVNENVKSWFWRW